jgi:hypothetical protein
MNIDELKESLTDEQRNVLYTLLCEVRDGLNAEIIDCNNYCREREDFGGTHRQDDPCETISYARGKSIGYIYSRDELNRLIKILT